MDFKILETVLRRQPLAAAFALNAVLFAVHFFAADIYYFSEKEVEWVSRILSPEWRTPNANSFFNNLIIWLQGEYPSQPWFKLSLFGTNFISAVGLSYCFFSVKPQKQTLFLYTAAFLFMLYYIGSYLTAEVTAGLSGLSGILMIILADRNEEKSNLFRHLFGSFLALWSGFLSWTTFGLLMMLILPFWLLTLRKEQQIKALITGGLLAVVVMLSLLADWYHYSTSTHNPDLLREQVLTSLRKKIAVTDMPKAELEENLDRAGLSYNDYLLLKSEFMLNNKSINIRSMSAFLAQQSLSSETDTIINYFRQTASEPYVKKLSGLSIIFIAFSLFFVVWDRYKLRILFISFAASVSWLLMFYAYSYSNLDSSYLAPGFFFISLLPTLIYLTSTQRQDFSKDRNLFIIAIFLCISGALLIASTNPHAKKYSSSYCDTNRCDWNDFAGYANENSNQLYVIWGNHRLNECFDTNTSLNFVNLRNVLWLKGDQQSKSTEERLDVFFIKDLPNDFLKRDHAYLVVPNYELEELKKMLITYFSEHQHQPVKIERVKIFKNFVIIRLLNY
jgi:hypothetical protein